MSQLAYIRNFKQPAEFITTHCNCDDGSRSRGCWQGKEKVSRCFALTDLLFSRRPLLATIISYSNPIESS